MGIVKYSKKYKTKKILLLMAIWLTIIVFLTICLLLHFVAKLKDSLIIGIALAFIIVIFIELIFLKPLIIKWDMKHRLYLVLENGNKPYHTKKNFDENWLSTLVKKGYKKGYESNFLEIYYQVLKSPRKRFFKTSYYLTFITIIKNNHIGFYDKNLEENYNNIYNKLEEKKRIDQQVIIQFKKYEIFTKEIKEELDKVISYRDKGNFYISLNCGYFSLEKKIYFLHSDKYYPNFFYKKAVEIIKDLT